MLRWKVRYVPLFVTAVLVVAALVNAKAGSPVNFEW